MYKPYLSLTAAMIGVSFAAVIIVSISEDVHPLAIAFYRLLFTSLILLLVIVYKRDFQHEFTNLKKSEILIMIFIGIVLAAHFAFWITSLTGISESFEQTTVASSVILVTAHPVLVAPLAYIFFRERFSAVNIIGISLSLIGITILVLGNYSNDSASFQANIMALLGGIAAGIYILGGKKMRTTVSTIIYAFIVYASATMTLLTLTLIFKASITNLTLDDAYLILAMAIVSGIFGHTLYNWTLKYLRATVISVSLLSEPLLSSLFAYLLPWINQIPTIYTILGGTCILSGIFLTTIKNTQHQQSKGDNKKI